jgi:hypothetical protein
VFSRYASACSRDLIYAACDGYQGDDMGVNRRTAGRFVLPAMLITGALGAFGMAVPFLSRASGSDVGLAGPMLAVIGVALAVIGTSIGVAGGLFLFGAVRSFRAARADSNGDAPSLREAFLFSAAGCVLAVVAIVLVGALNRSALMHNADNAARQEGVLEGELHDKTFVASENEASVREAQRVVLKHVGGAFRVKGVYRNSSGVHRVWVAHADYPRAQFVFRVVADSSGVRWADTPSQRNLLLIATRFSKEMDQESAQWPSDGDVIASEVSSVGGRLHVGYVHDPRSVVFMSSDVPRLQENSSLFEL